MAKINNNNTTTTTTTSNIDQSAIPRPLNCFLMYRLEKQKEIVAKCSGANHRDISKIIAKWWREASEAEKKPFRERARIAKIEHRNLYPDYKYTPKKKTAPKRVYIRKNKKEQFTSREKENNKFMEMIYDDCSALESIEQGKSIKMTTKKVITKKVTKKQQQQEKFEDKIYQDYQPDCRYASSTTPDFSSQTTSPFNDSFSDFSSPQAIYSPYETTMPYATMDTTISPFSVLDTPYINEYNAYATMPLIDQIDYFHFDHAPIASDNKYTTVMTQQQQPQEFGWTEYPDFCSTEQYQSTFNMLDVQQQLQFINPALLHM